MTPNRRLLSRLAAAALLLLPCVGCAGNGHQTDSEEVHELIRTVRYDEALERAQELCEKEPEDADLAELHRRAYVAWILNEGRVASFDDRDMQALGLFMEAKELAPESQLVQSWIEKTHRKIADGWISVAHEHLANDDLDAAAEAYARALEYAPGHPVCIRCLDETTVLMNHRLGLGADYYSDGISALNEFWLQQARWNFAATQKFTPENPRVDNRRADTEVQLAEVRVAEAMRAEENGLYAAALKDYRYALELDPNNVEAAEGAKRVAPERKAAKMIRDADMLIRRERYTDALELLAEAEELTLRQNEDITAARQTVDDQRLDTLYVRALNLEHDQQFFEAIEGYEKLFEYVEYYRDARTRQGTLADYIELAAKYYERYEQAEDDAERLNLLRAIRGFWSEYRDIADRIDELEDKLGTAAELDPSAG